MTDSFVVYLGGGLYLDSEGKLTTGPQSSRDQVYEASELKFDFIEAGKTLMEVSSFLTDEKTRERIVKLHISTVPMSVLLKGAEILGAATMLLSAAAFTFGAFRKLIELIEDKPEPISPLLQQHLLQIKDDLKAIDDRLTSDAVLSVLSDFRKTLTTFGTNLLETTIQNLKGAARIAKHVELQDDLDALDNALGTLMTQDWSPLYRFEQYKQLFFIEQAAALHVRNKDGSYSPYAQRDVVRRFDYRLGLTILGYVASVYPVLVATAVPWFRSSGSYAARLRQLANCIDDFVTRMYSECFARTIHTPDSMAYSEGLLPIVHRLPDGSTTLMPALGRRLTLQNEYLVGAVDLVRYSDAWFHKEFVSQYWGPEGQDTGLRGAFDFCWPRDGRKYVAPDAAGADEVNRESERVFGELILTSGIVQLSSAAARLRFLSTPPLESQTVTGIAAHARQFLSEDATEAKSPWIFGTGQVKRDAVLQKFDARAKATIQTQARGYPFAFNYRVRLVSMDHSIANTGIWANRDYHGHIWKGEYVTASGDPRDRRLDVSIDRNGLLGQHVIYEGSSPMDLKTYEGQLTFKGSTFDWYVPDLGAATAYDPDLTQGSIAAVKFKTGSMPGIPGGGGRSIHLERPAPMKLMKDEGDPLSWQIKGPPTFEGLFNNDLDMVFGETTELERYALEQAERRWVRVEEVKFQWKLVWHGQNLTLTVDGVPTDRPYQLLLVIEEGVYSGESLPENVGDPTGLESLRTEIHTVFPLEVVNQLVIVPDDFFRKEREALETARKCWQDCNKRFAISEGVGPRPPRGELHRKLSETLGNSASTASLAEKHNRQLAHVMATSPDVFHDAVQAGELPEADLERLAQYR